MHIAFSYGKAFALQGKKEVHETVQFILSSRNIDGNYPHFLRVGSGNF